jgi:predicted DNA-binding transcriptional regulator YafY
VVSVEPTDEPFERPAGFDAAAYGDPAQGVLESDLECELDLAPGAEWLADYVPILASERRGDGRLRVRLAVQELSWIVRQVLRLAPDAEPVAPPELRAAVATAARRSLARYGAPAGAQAAPPGADGGG